jgi:transposase InsO family protein
MRQDIKNWLTQCYECRSRRVPNQPQTPLIPLKVQDVFSRWHLDNTGPFPESESGNKFTITARDSGSGLFLAKAVKEFNARQHAIFIYEEIAMKFGLPEEIVTDQGSAFNNEVLKEFLTILKTKHRRTTPYHPRSNGKVERAHRDFHERLAFLTKGLVHKWDLFISEAVWAMNTRVSRTTGYSPFYLVYGKEPRTSLDPIARPFIFDLSDPRDALEKRARDLEKLGHAREAAKERVKMNNQKMVEAFNKRIKLKREIQVGDLVKILIPKRNRVKLGAHSEGLYKVTKVEDNNTVKLIDPTDPMAHETKFISRDNIALVGTTNPEVKWRKEFKGIKIKVPENPDVQKHVWTKEELRKEGIRFMS